MSLPEPGAPETAAPETAAEPETAAGAVAGWPRALLRLEGAAVLAVAAALYAHLGQGWFAFALLLIVPDVAMLAYLAGPRVGASAYNAAHSLTGPILLGIACTAPVAPPQAAWGLAFALIWAAHIGLDRLLGYGLKYPDAFEHTHLGWLGRGRPERGRPERARGAEATEAPAPHEERG